MATKKAKTRQAARYAGDGQFITMDKARKHPSTTVVEQVNVPKPKPKPKRKAKRKKP